MTKFFDFCDKYRKPLLGLLLVGVLLCFIFPCDCQYTIQIEPELVYSDEVPYFVALIGSYSFAIQYGEIAKGLAMLIAWLVLALSSIVLLIVAMFRYKAWLPAVSLFLCWLASWFDSIIVSISTSIQYPHLAGFYASANGYAALALFALYVLYLLLRRFYAPAKARVVASAERRKTSRKPTKDERIAELEKRVAELESKDKD